MMLVCCVCVLLFECVCFVFCFVMLYVLFLFFFVCVCAGVQNVCKMYDLSCGVVRLGVCLYCVFLSVLVCFVCVRVFFCLRCIVCCCLDCSLVLFMSMFAICFT